MLRHYIISAIILTSVCLSAQTLYDINTIQNIKITFTQSNWDYQLDTAKAGAEGYIMAQSVEINGIKYDSVGVKYKGNSTYRATQIKNPFHIELDTYKDQDYQGYTDIKLSNVAKDPTFVREVLSYEILRDYMDASLSNYANVYVNGSLLGLYSNSESISKKFVSKHFYSKDNVFVKCNPIAGAGPGSTAKPNLVYLGTDSSAYAPAYEMKSDYGWKELIVFCETLKNNVVAIEKVLDVDRALWMLAFDNVFVNLDSYIGGFAQNYYLYQDDHGRFNPVVWDLNESFGTFTQTGTINLNTTTSKQQLTHLLHLNDAAWPLVQKLLSIPRYKRMYIAHMKTMITEHFANGNYYVRGQALQSIINNAVLADPNKFFTYAQYQSNLTSDVSGGMGSTPGIKVLMDGRSTYLLGLADFTAVAPTINDIKLSNNTPVSNSTIYITTKVTGASDVIIGYRKSKQDPFTKVSMYDDGVHNDGAAGDQVYGIDILIKGDFLEYYFYADNDNAGIFSPVRAEHEFYTVYATQSNIVKGELVINELMADNGTTIKDANGEYDDWIELHNNTDKTLSLDNLYLSDSYSSPQKWQFPAGTTIGPKAYLIVWADDDEGQDGIHSTIKLSASGEKAILSYADGYVVDSVSFGAQTKDVSFLRCPNGTGDFRENIPSFGTENCLTVASYDIKQHDIVLYPNPGSGHFYIKNENNWIYNIEIISSSGTRVAHQYNLYHNLVEVLVPDAMSGVYFVKINQVITKKIVVI